ncbi:hypothetical protein L5M18_04005 [Shewanella sp. SM20]|uniref:hypothetical protein n=1 Tax=Shewanella sp. SM20 TaxID=2912792 RepID=UPI0021DB5FBF|nr:hypothetical protein [Shewanella sp. SM20]MCU8090736.1 hypothetical protein [Shewanella sp. SM20]
MKFNLLKIISIAFLGSLFGSVITIGSVAFFYGGDISKLLTESPYLLNHSIPELSRLDQIRIDRLLEKNVIFSADDLLGQMGAFYTTIITTLVSLIAAMGLFTFFFIKSSVEDKAEAQAKITAKQVIDGKIDPKIEQINSYLSKFDEQSLATKLDILLQTKILDSYSFWTRIEESIYTQTDAALQDYGLEEVNININKAQRDIKSIAENIQVINQKIENIEEKPADETDNIIDLGNGSQNGN